MKADRKKIGSILLIALLLMVTGPCVLLTVVPIRIEYQQDVRLARPSPLSTAIREERPLPEIEEMLKSNPALLHTRGGGQLPIYRAARKGRRDLVALFVEHGADVNVEVEEGWGGKGETPLVPAVRKNDLEMVRLLVEAGADLDAKGQWGETVFELAEDGDPALLRYLEEVRERRREGP